MIVDGKEVEYNSKGMAFSYSIVGVILDGEGATVYCKCGKNAETVILGQKSYRAFCSDCDSWCEKTSKLVYGPPNFRENDN
jgi:hypothetical protein